MYGQYFEFVFIFNARKNNVTVLFFSRFIPILPEKSPKPAVMMCLQGRLV